MPFPETEDDWKAIADEFLRLWNFPNCFAAADGKHIAITKPKLSGSTYWCYKQFYSIVLMALVDAYYRFIYVDIGCQGRLSDGGVWRNTSFYEKLARNELSLPADAKLSSDDLHDSLLEDTTDLELPYVFVADDAFALTTRCMKPFPNKSQSSGQRIFNYRLSRARRTSENAFGILAHRFRILMTRINATPESVSTITYSCCILHNMLTNLSNGYASGGYGDVVTDDGEIIEGQWRSQANPDNQMADLESTRSRKSSLEAEEIRVHFMRHFENKGQVPWQWKHV